MHTKSKAAIIFFIVVLFALSACNTNESSESILPFTPQPAANSSPNGACDNILFPVKLGATWTYTSTGGPAGTFTYTDTITNIHADGFTLTSQFDQNKHTQDWLCTADGLKALQLGGGAAAGVSTQGITAEFITAEITGLTLPKEITQGMQWQYNLIMQGTVAMPGDQKAEARGTYTVDMKEMGIESVVTPAGTFEATKLQANPTLDIKAVFEGLEVPIKFNGASLLWYAPGIGYVKSVENGDFGGTNYTVATELQTYNIP